MLSILQAIQLAIQIATQIATEIATEIAILNGFYFELICIAICIA